MRRLVACVVGMLGCNLDASGLGTSTAGTTGGGSSETGVATDASGDVVPTSAGTSAGTSDTSGSTGGTTGTTGTTGSTGVDDTSSGSDTGDVPMLVCEGQALAACYDFAGVGDGMLWDRSGNGNDAAAVGVGVVPGPFGDAATFDGGSEIAVPDSASLDIEGSITLEAWIMVDALPSSGRFGLLDDEGQYSLIVYDTGEYRCDMLPGTLFAGPVVLGEWTHVACVYDGAMLSLYVDGSEIGTMAASGSLLTNDGSPMAIGDTSPEFLEPFGGAIGGVRVWRRALDPAEL